MTDINLISTITQSLVLSSVPITELEKDSALSTVLEKVSEFCTELHLISPVKLEGNP